MLVEEIRAGDRKAIGTFVELYSDTVYSFLRRRLERADAADDLLQDVFLAAWARLGEFRGESALSTWLCAIARHKVADYYRMRMRELLAYDIEGLDDTTPPDPNVDFGLEDALDRDIAADTIRKRLDEMPELYRAALLWRYWNQRSLQEMAAISGKTVKATERLLARARADFARRWNHG
ncbi:MAG: RNA polymerase sigma factor [Gammaproteobacteria bacterium]